MCMVCMGCGRCQSKQANPDMLAFFAKNLKCTKCGTEIPSGARSCPECGRPAPLAPGVA